MTHTRFIVLTSARAGSTWLIDLLNSQPGVQAHGELLLGHARKRPAVAIRADYPRFVELHGSSQQMRPLKLFAYLNQLFETRQTVGFKLMYTQLRAHPETLAYLAFKRIRILHLVRLNHLDAIVSEELAKLTGESHAIGRAQSPLPKVFLQPLELIHRIRTREKRVAAARRFLRVFVCPSIEIVYERLASDKSEFGRIEEFLGIPGNMSDAQSQLVKRGHRPHQDAITNYDEVKQILDGTSFSRMLR